MRTKARTGRNRHRAAVAAAVAIALVAVAAPQALADNWVGPTNRTGCQQNITDTVGQNYFNVAADSRLWNQISWTRTNNIDPTDVNTSTATSWTTLTDVGVWTSDWSGNTQCNWTDPATGRVWLQPWCCEAATYTTDTRTQIPFILAAAWCETTNSAQECEQHRLYYDTDDINQNSWGTNYLRNIACHETGHTLGLTHVGGTCMAPSADPAQVGYSVDQKGHINAWFPEGSG